MLTKLSADESARLLARQLVFRKPYLFIRFGDGPIECIYNLRPGGGTCDRELYNEKLGAALKWCWDSFVNHERVYLGDWTSANFNGDFRSLYLEQWQELIGPARPYWVHYEALLLRESPGVRNFYRILANDPRRKVFLGPAAFAGILPRLGVTEHIITPMVTNLFSQVAAIGERLDKTDFDILLWGAGLAGHIPVIKNWLKHPERTYIHTGSALDPLARGKTRQQQITREQAEGVFKAIGI